MYYSNVRIINKIKILVCISTSLGIVHMKFRLLMNRKPIILEAASANERDFINMSEINGPFNIP